MKYDPIENTEQYQRAMRSIQPQLDREFRDAKGMGVCHLIWRRKKELLRSYGIEWRSPAECNPLVKFD